MSVLINEKLHSRRLKWRWPLSRQVTLSIGTLAVLLTVWWTVAALQLISPLFLPPPQQVLAKLLTIAGPQGFMDATLWQHLAASLTRPLSDNQFEQLYHAVLRHQVVFLRDQAITPQQQRALAQRFGELHIHPVYPHAEGVDEIIVLDTHNDNPPDNDNWHTDVTFIETPPAGAILAAKELPSTGGDTLWTSGIAAYEALSVPFRQLLSGLRAEHDFRKSFPEYKYRKTEEEHQRWREAVAKNPPLLHPVVRTHPVSGKQALFVNEGFTTRIVDVSEKESESLLGFLFAHITKPEFQVRWRWQPNDIAIWDNRVTQHYANADYLPQRRIMHRATILGDKPFYRAG
ncbi:taurine dioxygenase [Escherichia coli]